MDTKKGTTNTFMLEKVCEEQIAKGESWGYSPRKLRALTQGLDIQYSVCDRQGNPEGIGTQRLAEALDICQKRKRVRLFKASEIITVIKKVFVCLDQSYLSWEELSGTRLILTNFTYEYGEYRIQSTAVALQYCYETDSWGVLLCDRLWIAEYGHPIEILFPKGKNPEDGNRQQVMTLKNKIRELWNSPGITCFEKLERACGSFGDVEACDYW